MLEYRQTMLNEDSAHIQKEVAIYSQRSSPALAGDRQPAIAAPHGTRHVPASPDRWLCSAVTPVPGHRNRGACRFREALAVGDPCGHVNRRDVKNLAMPEIRETDPERACGSLLARADRAEVVRTQYTEQHANG